MLLRILFCLFFSLSQSAFLAQEVVTVSGSYSDEVSNLETKEQAQTRIKQRALIDALQQAFGTAIFEGNSLYIRNNSDGSLVETTTGFDMIAETYVKGEVMEELNVDFIEHVERREVTVFNEKKRKQEKRTDNVLYIECKVKIKAREYIEPICEFKAETLNCPDTVCKTSTFRNDENFYVYFKSEKSGYLTIFLDDNESSSILLPYIENRQNFQHGYPVEAGKDYILFKNDKRFFDPTKTSVDEIAWQRTENLEKLSLIFTTKPFELPSLKKNDEKIVRYTLPDNLPSAEFNKWLINLRSKNKTVEIKRIFLSSSSY